MFSPFDRSGKPQTILTGNTSSARVSGSDSDPWMGLWPSPPFPHHHLFANFSTERVPDCHSPRHLLKGEFITIHPSKPEDISQEFTPSLPAWIVLLSMNGLCLSSQPGKRSTTNPMTRVLSTDDSVLQRKTLSMPVQDDEHEFDTANNDRGGLKKIQANPPECLLLDMLMPEIDGMQILETLQAQEI